MTKAFLTCISALALLLEFSLGPAVISITTVNESNKQLHSMYIPNEQTSENGTNILV